MPTYGLVVVGDYILHKFRNFWCSSTGTTFLTSSEILIGTVKAIAEA